jgi:hypothetical protein
MRWQYLSLVEMKSIADVIDAFHSTLDMIGKSIKCLKRILEKILIYNHFLPPFLFPEVLMAFLNLQGQVERTSRHKSGAESYPEF